MSHQRKVSTRSGPVAPTPEDVQAVPPADETANVQEDAIRRLAYRKWEEAGRPATDGREFWLEAERELRHAFAD